MNQLHIWVNAAVALVGMAPNHLLTVSTSGRLAGFAYWAGQGELQLTATSNPGMNEQTCVHVFSTDVRTHHLHWSDRYGVPATSTRLAQARKGPALHTGQAKGYSS